MGNKLASHKSMQIVMIHHSSPLFLDIGRNIKLSSPRLNNMAAVGCGLVYGAVILLGLDDATLPDSDGYYPTVCKVKLFIHYKA